MQSTRTLLAATAAIRQRDLTPRQLLSDCLRQIDLHESSIAAWTVVDRSGALATAEQLTEEQAHGLLRGPLHGIPVGIKDIVDVKGLPTRAGSPLTDDRPAVEDATIVARLRAAGAIILGKTVTTEFACFDPSPTRNPWNHDRTPGGSSSGSAAALALGMCLGAIGSQTGGSITRPASYCGVAGCKPTFGCVSRRGVMPVTFHLDHVGPMARTAADCAVLLAAIAGDDPSDPGSSPRANSALPTSGSSTASFPSETGAPQLGVFRSFFFDGAEAETAQLTDAALARLVERGAGLVDLSLPAEFANVHTMHRRIMAAEAADFHRFTFGAPRSGYSPKIEELLAEGFAVSMADYQEALRHRSAFRAAMTRTLAGVDALVTPATLGPAPARETTGDPRFNSPWSHAGLPTFSIPCAWTSDGLPLSLQLIGPAWSEERLLDIATWCEELLGFEYPQPA